MQNESPRVQLERETAERQRLVDLAYSNLPPPPAGMKRLMWFGDSDTPMPIDVPEDVFLQIQALSEKAGADPAPIDILERLQAEKSIRKLVQPYIDAKYPTLPRLSQDGSWWQRILRKFGLRN